MVSCLGSLVQSCCGEGGALQTNLTGVCGEPSQCSSHTGFAPLPACVLSPSTGFRLQAALQGVGPELCALPRPKLFRFRFSGTPQRHRLSWAFVLCLPRQEQLRQPGAWRAHSPRVQCTLSPPRSQPQFPRLPVGCALCLFWEADFWLRPSQWMSTIQNLRKSLVRSWKPVCHLVGGAVSGALFAPFPSLVPPASGRGWAGLQLASSCLVFTQSSVLGTGG